MEPILADMLKDERHGEVILVEGVRQVGKSYLVGQVLAGLG
jgi:predicted AAA+ superfamily ATPase